MPKVGANWSQQLVALLDLCSVPAHNRELARANLLAPVAAHSSGRHSSIALLEATFG